MYSNNLLHSSAVASLCYLEDELSGGICAMEADDSNKHDEPWPMRANRVHYPELGEMSHPLPTESF